MKIYFINFRKKSEEKEEKWERLDALTEFETLSEAQQALRYLIDDLGGDATEIFCNRGTVDDSDEPAYANCEYQIFSKKQKHK